MSKLLENKVQNIIVSVLKISPSAYSDDLAVGEIPEWDSINHVRLLAQIEEDFNINIDITDAIEIEDVWDIISTLKKYKVDVD